MRAHEQDIVRAIEAPTETAPGRAQDEQWYYLGDAGPSPLDVGDPSRAVDFDETPEGHAVRFDREGEVIGLTLVRPKRLMERDGELRLTLPVRRDVLPEQLALAVIR